jgi:hypothetical protein
MHPDMPDTAIGSTEPQWPAAVAWGGRLRGQDEEILPYQVPRLQRESKTGYSHTCAPVKALALDGHRIIGSGGEGTRYARLRTGEAA